jgi:anti-sigma factor RsiW
VAAAVLGIGPDEAARELAGGRLQLFAEVSGRELADLAAHRPHPAADPGVLARYVDGTVPAQRQIAVARHVAACAECADLVTAQDRARRLVAELPVIEMPDDQRTAVLSQALGHAAQALPPSVDLVTFTSVEAESPAGIDAVLVLALLVLAAFAGLAVGMLAAR